MKTPIVFVDLETGGLAPNHPDIQVAAIAVQDWTELQTYEAKIAFEESAADPEVLAMNSYDAAAWAAQAKPEERVVAELQDFLRAYAVVAMTSQRGRPYSVARLAGHNIAQFDAPRLKRMFDRHGAFLPAAIYQPLDTLQLALWRCAEVGIEPANYKLGDLCRRFGVVLPDGAAHDALADVRATIGLAKALGALAVVVEAER